MRNQTDVLKSMLPKPNEVNKTYTTDRLSPAWHMADFFFFFASLSEVTYQLFRDNLPRQTRTAVSVGVRICQWWLAPEQREENKEAISKYSNHFLLHTIMVVIKIDLRFPQVPNGTSSIFL